jgi:transcription termination factor Rho
MPDGFGYLRSPARDYDPDGNDPWVPREIVASLQLETGVEVAAMAVPGARPGAGPGVARVVSLNGLEPEAYAKRTPFKSLVAEDPTERIRLEMDPAELSTRVVDLIAPIGKGQRCLIVAPPKAGKTVLLQKIARSITTNHPEIHLIVLLVDERPEEVTDMRRNVRGEVIASSSDELARNHLQVAEIALERAKRLVETGRDVVVLLDSITRLSRAYNNEQKGSGACSPADRRTDHGEAEAVLRRRAQGHLGGSLTVIGTALVDTGSRMDEVIFQEFKGTGNTEIVMDRSLFERRIFPRSTSPRAVPARRRSSSTRRRCKRSRSCGARWPRCVPPRRCSSSRGGSRSRRRTAISSRTCSAEPCLARQPQGPAVHRVRHPRDDETLPPARTRSTSRRGFPDFAAPRGDQGRRPAGPSRPTSTSTRSRGGEVLARRDRREDERPLRRPGRRRARDRRSPAGRPRR